MADEFNAEKVSNTLWAYATGRTHRRKDQESRAAIQTAGDHKHSVGIRHPAATAGRGGDDAHVYICIHTIPSYLNKYPRNNHDK